MNKILRHSCRKFDTEFCMETSACVFKLMMNSTDNSPILQTCHPCLLHRIIFIVGNGNAILYTIKKEELFRKWRSARCFND